MAEIEYIGNGERTCGTEEEWLGEPWATETWYAYYRKWPAGEVYRTEEWSGDHTLSEIVQHIQQEDIDPNYDSAPCVYISPEPIQEFYPQVKENFPPDLCFFDGGGWYWTESCESGKLDFVARGEEI